MMSSRSERSSQLVFVLSNFPFVFFRRHRARPPSSVQFTTRLDPRDQRFDLRPQRLHDQRDTLRVGVDAVGLHVTRKRGGRSSSAASVRGARKLSTCSASYCVGQLGIHRVERGLVVRPVVPRRLQPDQQDGQAPRLRLGEDTVEVRAARLRRQPRSRSLPPAPRSARRHDRPAPSRSAPARPPSCRRTRRGSPPPRRAPRLQPALQLRNEALLLHQPEALRQAVAQRHDGDLLGKSGQASAIAAHPPCRYARRPHMPMNK
jgi:hypothetical protein